MISVRLSENPISTSIPCFLDRIKAGFPSPAADYEEDELDFNQLLIKRKAATYCLRVSGNSMIGAGIFSNDILVVDRSITPSTRDIVVASVNGEFTVKRLIKHFNSALLHAENPDFPDIYLDSENDAEIFGVVTSVVRQFRKR